MPEAQTVEEYMWIAEDRVGDARALLNTKRYRGAYYICGYGVECSLKALLLDRSTPAQRPKVLKFCRGKNGHNLAMIKDRLSARGVQFPRPVARAFAIVRSWSVGLRYNTDDRTRHATAVLLGAADVVMTWIRSGR